MANKAPAVTHHKKDSIRVKHVKRAQMWVKTTIQNNKQTQEWAMTKGELNGN